LVSSKTRAELEQSQLAQEQIVVELSQTRNARRESEETRKANNEDLAKFARAVGAVMTRIGVPFGPMLPDRLLEEVGCLPGVIRELEPSMARREVH
jgi:hypothetical protein